MPDASLAGNADRKQATVGLDRSVTLPAYQVFRHATVARFGAAVADDAYFESAIANGSRLHPGSADTVVLHHAYKKELTWSMYTVCACVFIGKERRTW